MTSEDEQVAELEVLEKHLTITFSNRDFDAFLEAIESEEEPNSALKQVRSAIRSGRNSTALRR